VTETILPVPQQKILESFVEKIKHIYGKGFLSAILYGSAASGEFAEKYSNINLLIVLTNTSLAELSKASCLVNSKRFSSISPIFFTEEYMSSSTDVFPIEFLDMKENYRVLDGKDVLAELVIDARNLRFQCEQELKSKLITIKRQYLVTQSRRGLEKLLFKSFTSTVHIMRNLLRLKGKNAPYQKYLLLDEIEKEFSVNMTAFDEILWAKSKNMTLSYKDIDSLLVGLVTEVEALIRIVDKMRAG